MFELILMRHAKSDWHSHMADIERPLSDRGVADAVAVGAFLKQNNISPDKMVISTAQRTRETAELLRQNISLEDEEVIFDQQLYLADRETLCDNIEYYASENKCLLLLAHNPGMDNLVSYLAAVPPPLTQSGKLMTTCAVAWFFVDSLEALKSPGQCNLQKLIRAKEITGG